MKLELLPKFSLEIPQENGTDEIITGTFAPFSKKQQAEAKKTFKENTKNTKKLQKDRTALNRFILKVQKAEKDNAKDLDKLYIKLDKMTNALEADAEAISEINIAELASKTRFDLSVKSEKIVRLREICDLIGYETVVNTIYKAVDEGKSENTTI